MLRATEELVKAVKDHALTNYEAGGWDVIVECWSDEEIAIHVLEAGATTAAKAIASFRELVDVWADRQADARQYGDDWAGGY